MIQPTNGVGMNAGANYRATSLALRSIQKSVALGFKWPDLS